MQSLYDVFSAIQADEGDHVKTMQACLDPQVTLRSPSIERKVLTGLALVAAVSFFYATTSGELSSLMDTLDFAGDVAGPGDLAVDAAVAGAAFAKEVAAEDAGEASMVSMGLPVVGESVRRLFVQAAEVLARIIATLI